MIRTDRLDLIPATAAHLRAELAGRLQFQLAIGIDVPPSWPPDLYDESAVEYTLAQLTAQRDIEPWGMYYIVYRDAGDGRSVLVGVGGFKGPPDDNGRVEIGYGVVSEFQRRGLATEAVGGMVRFAMSTPGVARIITQTLPHLAPSIGVLLQAGFQFAGPGHDPSAPPAEEVVRYELQRPPPV